MSNRILSRDEAEAILIKSVGNLVWVLALAIVLGAYLALVGNELGSNTISGIKTIFVGSFWLIFGLRVLDIVDKYLHRDEK